MQHGETRTNMPPYQAIKTNYKLLRSKMRWFSNSSTWNDPIDVTVKYNIEKDVELLDSNFDEYALSKLHPTQKSLPLIAYPMKLSSMKNGIVVDLFGGSGSALMAVDQLNRTAYLMELDSKYGSSIVRRYIASHAGDISNISVKRDGNEISCSEVYVPSDDDWLSRMGLLTTSKNGRRKIE